MPLLCFLNNMVESGSSSTSAGATAGWEMCGDIIMLRIVLIGLLESRLSG